MHVRYCKKLVLAALGILLLTGISGALTSAADRPLLILADLSGSSQKKLSYLNPPQNTPVQITRADAMKELLTLFAGNLPANYCPLGLFEVRYLSGDENCYVPVIPVAAYQNGELQLRLKDDLTTETPIFNRRTPLADSLRQMDVNILKPLDGNAVILLISDGEENIRSGDNEASDDQTRRTDDPVGGPLSELRKLKNEYGDRLSFHAIGLECGNPGDENGRKNEGLDLLQKMTAAGGGKYFSARELLQDRQAIADLYPLLCGNAGLLPR